VLLLCLADPTPGLLLIKTHRPIRIAWLR
jgi:hypothetical protein